MSGKAECVRYTKDCIFLDIKANPGASKTAAGRAREGRLKIRIAAAPEDGKANEELRAFMAKALGLAKKDVLLESGERSRLKTLRLPLTARAALENFLSRC